MTNEKQERKTSSRKKPKHQIICKFHAKGKCKKGNKCEYKHAKRSNQAQVSNFSAYDHSNPEQITVDNLVEAPDHEEEGAVEMLEAKYNVDTDSDDSVSPLAKVLSSSESEDESDTDDSVPPPEDESDSDDSVPPLVDQSSSSEGETESSDESDSDNEDSSQSNQDDADFEAAVQTQESNSNDEDSNQSNRDNAEFEAAVQAQFNAIHASDFEDDSDLDPDNFTFNGKIVPIAECNSLQFSAADFFDLEASEESEGERIEREIQETRDRIRKAKMAKKLLKEKRKELSMLKRLALAEEKGLSPTKVKRRSASTSSSTSSSSSSSIKITKDRATQVRRIFHDKETQTMLTIRNKSAYQPGEFAPFKQSAREAVHETAETKTIKEAVPETAKTKTRSSIRGSGRTTNNPVGRDHNKNSRRYNKPKPSFKRSWPTKRRPTRYQEFRRKTHPKSYPRPRHHCKSKNCVYKCSRKRTVHRKTGYIVKNARCSRHISTKNKKTKLHKNSIKARRFRPSYKQLYEPLLRARSTSRRKYTWCECGVLQTRR